MNEPIPPTSTPPASGNAADAVTELRKQIQNILILITVVVAVLDLFMFRESVIRHKDLATMERQFAPIKAESDRTRPKVDTFVKQLSDFGRTHSDFQAVLAKYPLQSLLSSAQTGLAVPAPAKAPPPGPAKVTAPASKK